MRMMNDDDCYHYYYYNMVVSVDSSIPKIYQLDMKCLTIAS